MVGNQLDDSKSLHKTGLFHHFHPLKSGCLGYQGDINSISSDQPCMSFREKNRMSHLRKFGRIIDGSSFSGGYGTAVSEGKLDEITLIYPIYKEVK